MATVQLELPSTNINVVTFSGSVNISKEIKGDMELIIEANRCSLDRKTCEKYPGATVHRICKKFDEKNTFYSSFFENIKPAFKCPIKPGLYTVDQTKLDLNAISMLPLDGYLWVVTFKMLTADAGNKRKQTAMCLNSEIKVLRTSIRST